jgi:Rrf2 family protein
MLYIAHNQKSRDFITIQTLSEKLEISRIYLEQVFALLKRADLVISAKGSQGGYQLSRHPKDLSIVDILSATESSLFEKAFSNEGTQENYIDKTLREVIFDKLDERINSLLGVISLQDLLSNLENQVLIEGYMYQI